MKSLTQYLLAFFAISTLAQTQYKEIPSSILGESRQIKIQLPRNYDKNIDKKYPVIIALDGDYLFEPVAGNVDFLSYWEEMPEAIVVGIVQGRARDADSLYEDVNFLPTESGMDFFEFLGLECMPWLDKNYRTSNFRMLIGHDITANFSNYYLMKDPAIFQAYVNLSPDLAPKMADRLTTKLAATEQPLFFYMATSSNDIKSLTETILPLDKALKSIKNESLHYFSDNFEGASHYSLVGRAIPKALEHVFSIFKPISKKEYKEEMLTAEKSPYQYLIDKYETLNILFAIEGAIRVNDYMAAYQACLNRSDWESLENLGKLARKQYPDTMLGNYFIAYSLEQSGEPKKAMKAYQNAYLLDEISFLTKDLVLDKAAIIKEDFGYN